MILLFCHYCRCGTNTQRRQGRSWPRAWRTEAQLRDALKTSTDSIQEVSRSKISSRADKNKIKKMSNDPSFLPLLQVWHEHTEETVEKLAQSSEDVVEQLEESGRLQESMIQQQNQSLKNQEQILAQEAQLRDALKTSTNSIQEVCKS